MAKVDVFARTEVGCIRERNEDAFLVSNLGTRETGLAATARSQDLATGGTLVAVCDGMGGAAAGDMASDMATAELHRRVQQHAPFRDSASVQAALLDGVGAANRTIRDFAEANPEKRGMGTTLTAALILGAEVHVAHIGDSRAYLRRGRSLIQLTTDHSVVGQMIAQGQLTPAQAREFEHRNVLLQALGVQEVISPEIVILTAKAGDVLMLCSDGLTGPLDDDRILELLLSHQDPVRCCRALTEAACAEGGPDNITVAVARFAGKDLALPGMGERPAFNRAQHTLS